MRNSITKILECFSARTRKQSTGSTLHRFGILLLPLLLGACNKDVDFGEQYKKTVYIVNATSYIGDHYFGAEADNIVISVYVASSEPIASDLKVRLMIDPYVLDSLNRLNALSNSQYIDREQLPEDNYAWPTAPIVTIKAGHQYGTLKIPFSFEGLDPDTYYALPLYVASNSAAYDINPDKQIMLYQINMINDYSGVFNGSSSELPETENERAVIKGVQPTLKALSKNTIRMPIHDNDNDITTVGAEFMVLTVDADNNVRISPWGAATVTDLGGSYYDPLTMKYLLNYQYKGKNIEEALTNINAPVTDSSEL
ncbi:MAG: DUF4361 domain-containing protein [Bacteroidales bacterium]|jgi:hypothetical protein|nr:DUF4361 domain-containing protein [Bacteroidales bacterium]